MRFSGQSLRRALALSCALSCAVSCTFGLFGPLRNTAAAQERKPYQIKEQTLADALREFTLISKRNLLFSPDLVRGKTTKGASGSFSDEEVLQRILTGTGLEFDLTSSGVLVIRRAALRTDAAPEAPAPVQAALPARAPELTEAEIVVTGTRVVREGYEAPTPLTVVGVEAIQQNAAPNIMNLLTNIPSLSGSALTSNHVNTTTGAAGAQTVNLRSLGNIRTLVLLDGRRSVGVSYTGVVDVGSFPQHLIERVDIVTGGASAVYGSDAVAGVVNFILDKDYNGVKGEISGGLTRHGDAENYKVNLTAGFPFGGGRGHILVSGEHLYNDGVQSDGGRAWNRTGYLEVRNPAYAAGNGQPLLFIAEQSSIATAAPGGLIVEGPLKGTAFGPGGAPFRFNYGSFLNPYMIGGDWKLNDLRSFFDLESRQSAQSLFTYVTYDVTDRMNAYVQYSWSQNHMESAVNRYWMFGGPMGPVIRSDNAYLPAAVRAAMAAGNITSFQLGTFNADLGTFGPNNTFITHRVNAGLRGTVSAFGADWNWDVNYGFGATDQNARTDPGLVTSLFRQAIDAVVDPRTGVIVCRSSLADPGNGCRPWNAMGVNVNAGEPSFFRPDFQYASIEQEVYSASLVGEPFALWAGPLSLAASAEHRRDEIHSVVDPYSSVFDRPVGNFSALNGRQSVTEAALETVVPLAADEDEAWARSWDVSAAVRFTDYELSGFVTTWKVGSTYRPVDDVMFRVTRSRDIRAPNLQELFRGPNASGAISVIDPARNNAVYPIDHGLQTSNPNLRPEKADTTNLGVVFSPGFLKGFTASVDVWDVDIKGAILPLDAQEVVNSCYTTRPQLCSAITRNPQTGLIATVAYFPINLATQNMRGIDIEASYRAPLSRVVPDWNGTISLHGLFTRYLRNYQDNTFNAPSNHVGENAGNPTDGGAPPYWKLNVTATYALDPVMLSVTGRGVSSGRINSEYVACASGCPAPTPDHPTINSNHISGAFYLDAGVTYKIQMGHTRSADIFFSAKNLLNKDPPAINASFLQSIANNSVLYDALGTTFRAGLRFRL